MGGRGSSWEPWCIAGVAFASLMVLATYRMDLNVRREQWRQAAIEAIEIRRIEAACVQLRARVSASERESERARAFLRQDVLVPRAILALESARPPGIGIDAVTWRTDYLAEGPCLTLGVSGWAATPVESQATQAWNGWVQGLKATLPWEAPLTRLSGPFWSRRSGGSEPSLAFRASFQTRPTPIPPK